MPYKFGYDFSGAVAGVGDEVTKWKIGDEVFGVLPFQERGTFIMIWKLSLRSPRH